MTVALDRPFFNAVLSHVAAVVSAGDAVAPSSHDGKYAIVWPMPSGGTDGPLGDINADEDFVVQITSVGSTREQAQWVADRVKTQLLTVPLSLPGRTLMRPPRIDVGTGLTRDDDTAGPPVFYAAHRYRFETTPA